MTKPKQQTAAFTRRIALLALAALFAGGIWFGMLALEPAKPLAGDASKNSFSAARAKQHLLQIAAMPHPIGSPAQYAVRDYLVQQLAAFGMHAEIQRTTGINESNLPIVLAGAVENVVVRLPGSHPQQTVMIVTHYDSVPTGPGANDDGVAVAAMLETIRALRAGSPLQNDLLFLFTDGEESGLLGAEAFVRAYSAASQVDIVLNFESRGSSGPTLMFETSPGNAAMIDELAAVPNPVASSLFADVYQQLPNDTDFTIFKAAGLSGLNFAYIGNAVHYHSSTDTVTNVNLMTLQHTGASMLALAQRFGNRSVSATASTSSVYFNLGPLPLIHYPSSVGIVLTGITALITLGVLILGLRKRRLSAGGIALGFGSMLISLMLASLSVTGIWLGVKLLVKAYSRFTADVYGSSVYFISFSIIAIAIVGIVYRLVGRRIHSANLLAGTLLWWLLLMILVTVALPGGSYLFSWPLLMVSLGFGLSFLAPSLDIAELPGIFMISMAAIPGMMLLSPIIALIFTALTLAQPLPGVVLIVLLAGLATPWLVALGRVKRDVLFTIVLVLGFGLALISGQTATFNRDRPIPTSLAYGLNADSEEAWWLSSDQAPNDWTEGFLSSSPDLAQNQDFFPYSTRKLLRESALPINLPAPSATLVDDTTSNAIRTVRLHIASPRQAAGIFVYVAEPTTIVTATVNDIPLTRQDGNSLSVNGRWAIRYWAPGPGGFELTLSVPAGQKLSLILVDEDYALPAMLPADLPQQPEVYIPSPFGFGIPHMTFVRSSVSF